MGAWSTILYESGYDIIIFIMRDSLAAFIILKYQYAKNMDTEGYINLKNPVIHSPKIKLND